MKLIFVISVLICWAISNISAKSALINPLLYKENEIYSRSGKLCQCMNNHMCHGEINSDIQCHPSYIMVCCIIPAKAEVEVQLLR